MESVQQSHRPDQYLITRLRIGPPTLSRSTFSFAPSLPSLLRRVRSKYYRLNVFFTGHPPLGATYFPCLTTVEEKRHSFSASFCFSRTAPVSPASVLVKVPRLRTASFLHAHLTQLQKLPRDCGRTCTMSFAQRSIAREMESALIGIMNYTRNVLLGNSQNITVEIAPPRYVARFRIRYIEIQ